MVNSEDFFDKRIKELKKTILGMLNKCGKVFIIPHKNMDFDALASAIAFADICNFFGIEYFIVTNDNPEEMKPSLGEVYNSLTDEYDFIDSDSFKGIRKQNDLLVVVDSNATNLIPIQNINSLDNDILIIDHHKTDDRLIKTNNLFINLEVSSASEIMFYLLKEIGIYISKETAQLLLAGIYLDTNGLYFASNPSSFNTVTKLLQYGANLQDVQSLFTISNFEDDRKYKRIINDLIDCTKFYHDADLRGCAITFNTNNTNTVYTHEQLSVACNSLLQYPIDSAFVIGFIDKKDLGSDHEDKIAIKARSKMGSLIDVSEIMQLFGGGGDENRAACEIPGKKISCLKDILKDILKNKNTLDKDQILIKVK